MVKDTELALNFRAKGWLFFPGPAPLLLPLPRPCWKRTLGSAGPAQRSSVLGLSCCLYCSQSPPCRGAHHPVLTSRCCCCYVGHGFPGNGGREGRKGKGWKIQKGRETESGGGWGERRRRWKEKLLKGRSSYSRLEREKESCLLWVCISTAPAPLNVSNTQSLGPQPLFWDGRGNHIKSLGFLCPWPEQSAFLSRIRFPVRRGGRPHAFKVFRVFLTQSETSEKGVTVTEYWRMSHQLCPGKGGVGIWVAKTKSPNVSHGNSQCYDSLHSSRSSWWMVCWN